MDFIRIMDANTHNLQQVSVDIPRNKLVVMTGVSGSGKSSLAFDTLFAEGQRRYLERLNTYARQFMPQQDRPDVGSIEGLSPTVAIQQKTVHASPRSTVGTVTEILDYLRVLYARAGTAHCPVCQTAMQSQSPQQVADAVLHRWGKEGMNTKLQVFSPVIRGRKGTYNTLLDQWRKEGISRVRIDGTIHLLEDLPEGHRLSRQQAHTLEIVVDRLVLKGNELDAEAAEKTRQRLLDAVQKAMAQSDGFVTLEKLNEDLTPADVWHCSRHLACPFEGNEEHDAYIQAHGDIAADEMAPRLFSFNSPYGACTACDGLGVKWQLDADRVVAYPQRALENGAIPIIGRLLGRYADTFIGSVLKQHGIKKQTPWEEWPANKANAFLYGSPKTVIDRKTPSLQGVDEWPLFGGSNSEGLLPFLQRRADDGSDTDRRLIESLMTPTVCAECCGDRLKPLPRSVSFLQTTLPTFCRLSVTQALATAQRWRAELLPSQQLIAYQPLVEVEKRLQFLHSVGLGYLTLDRRAGTLSGGEAQRIRLASQLGAGLCGVLYVLDEPSIGLHAHNTTQLIETLQQLRDQGNSVVVVEHDEDTIRAADWVIDLGPLAGALGGHIVAEGPVKSIEDEATSLTGQYLKGSKRLPVPEQRRPVVKGETPMLTVHEATRHNLKNLTVSVPLSTFTAVTGLSGSGKSTLIMDILVPALRHALKESHLPPDGYENLTGFESLTSVVEVDQSPIGRTPRSTPSTYLGLMDDLRLLFSSLERAQINGWGLGRFSFNTRGGRCETCKGLGAETIALGILPDAQTTCGTCLGKRYNADTLTVTYNGHTIADVLALTVDEALVVFEAQTKIHRQLLVLADVGLGYLTLGQAANTLSGGEAQRLKLASELVQQRRGNVLYVLDEPTVGLHWEDVGHLLTVIQRLVEAGHTVLVIEHHLELIAAADWVLDLGPGAGEAGGELVAQGPPEVIAQSPQSLTGPYLGRYL